MLNEFTVSAVAQVGDLTLPERLNDGEKGLLVSIVTQNIGAGEIESVNLEVANGAGGFVTLYTLTPAANISEDDETHIFILYPEVDLDDTNLSGHTVGILPRRWRLVVNHTNSTAMTYKITYQTLA